MSAKTYRDDVHKDVRAVSVGWLGKKVVSRGTVPPVAMEILRHYREYCYQEDGYRGDHYCEICGEVPLHGEFWMETSNTRYVLPTGVLHYIEEHGYCPPSEFLRDIMALPRLDKQVRRKRLFIAIPTALVVLFIGATGIRSYISARPTAQRNSCISNLRVIRDAKVAWLLKRTSAPLAAPVEADLLSPDGTLPLSLSCPRGGVYNFGRVGENPSCTLSNKGHRLDDVP